MERQSASKTGAVSPTAKPAADNAGQDGLLFSKEKAAILMDAGLTTSFKEVKKIYVEIFGGEETDIKQKRCGAVWDLIFVKGKATKIGIVYMFNSSVPIAIARSRDLRLAARGQLDWTATNSMAGESSSSFLAILVAAGRIGEAGGILAFEGLRVPAGLLRDPF